MAFLSQIKFAELAGTSHANVKLAVKNGDLATDPKSKGIDPENPKNKSWLEEWTRKKSKKNPDASQTVERVSSYASLEDQKLEQEIKLKIEQTLAIKQKRLAGTGVLILRELVEKRLAKLGQALKTHVLTTPRKISPKIFSLVKAGATVAEIEKEIARELEKALANSKVK